MTRRDARWLGVFAALALALGCTTTTAAPDGGADSGADSDASCTVPTCTPVQCQAPLADGCDGGSCPSLRSDSDVAALCAQYAGQVSRSSRACKGTQAIAVRTGGDCTTWYLFDDATSTAVAVAGQCNSLVRCSGGSAGYVVDPTCFYDDAYALVPACAAADAGDAAARDGATE